MRFYYFLQHIIFYYKLLTQSTFGSLSVAVIFNMGSAYLAKLAMIQCI